MKRNFEERLPDGYQLVKVIDAKEGKTAVILSISALVATIILAYLGVVLVIKAKGAVSFDEFILSSRYFIFLAVMILYTIAHELTPGAAYKLLTGQKLTFGLTLTVAFCGVPQIYVYRKAALISVLAPFVVFSIVFGLPLFFLNNAIDLMITALMLAIHLGGCVGDLYVAWELLFRFKDENTLMNDTGPKQTFYQKVR